jgi:hypothetical protein
VQGGAQPRIFGYDVQDDLARHYSFGETILLCLTGEVPNRVTGKAFEIALTFLAPVPAGEAPSHASGLAHLLGADAGGVATCAAIGLAERARYLVAQHTDLLSWFAAPDTDFPAAKLSAAAPNQEAVERLCALLKESGFDSRVLPKASTLLAVILGVLYACGLRRPAQFEAAVCIAGLPSVIAEGFAAKPYDFFNYPMNLPAFRYVEDRGSD